MADGLEIPNDHRAVTRMPQEAPAKGDPPEPDTAAPATAALGRQMAKGTGWMVLMRLSMQGIGFVSTLILARLLMPSDFGLVALATSLAGALQAVSDFSFDTMLIQSQRAGRGEYDTAWTLSVCRNVILATCLFLAAPMIAPLFDEPRLAGVVHWLAFATLVEGFLNIGVVDFRKDLTFHKDLTFNVLGKLCGFLITVPLAFMWRDYSALISGLVGGTFGRVALSYFMCGFRPRFSFTRWREVMHFSKWLVLNNVCILLFNRSDTFVIGKVVGAQAVGIYSVAFEIANLTTANLLTPLRRALFPAYAKVSDDPEELRKAFVDVVAVVMLVGTPISLGIGLVAAPLVHLMLGPQWIDSIPLIQVLTLYGFLNLISAGSGPVFLATGRPQYYAWIMGGGTIILLPLLIFGVQSAGTLGVAWAVTITTALAVVVDFFWIIRLLRFSGRRLLLTFLRPLAAASIMAMAVISCQLLRPPVETTLGWTGELGIDIIIGVITYISASFLLWRLVGSPNGAETHILGALRNGITGLSRAVR